MNNLNTDHPRSQNRSFQSRFMEDALEPDSLWIAFLVNAILFAGIRKQGDLLDKDQK